MYGSNVTVDHLTYHAETVGDRIAVIDDRPEVPVRTINYDSFNTLVNQLTNGLLGLGAELGSHIAWWGNNSLETLAAMHAIRKAGGVSVPIPYRSTPAEASYLLGHADANILIIESTYLPVLSSIRGQLPKLQHVIAYGSAEQHSGVLLWEDALGEAQTPTSEGKSENVDNDLHVRDNRKTKRRHATCRRGNQPVWGVLEFIGWDKMEELIFLTTGPLYHSGPSGFARRAQLVGATIVCQYTFDPEDCLRLVETHRVSATFSAPTPIRRITALPKETKNKYDVSSMQSMIANAAPWTMALKKAYLRDFPPDSLWEIYGSTELSVCTVLAPEDQLRKPGSCGLPSPGVEIQLVDDEGKVITQPDTPGELYARSVALFDTYYKAEEKYLEDHLDGFQTVGDIAYKDTDGYFYICIGKKT